MARVQSQNRANVDDATLAAPPHRRQHGVGHAHDAEQIDVEQSLHLCDRGFLGAAKQADTGIVDQQVDAAGLSQHG
jgi:hypothetical protein